MSTSSFGQVKTNILNSNAAKIRSTEFNALNFHDMKSIPIKLNENFDFDMIKKNLNNESNYFGFVFDVNITINDGVWEEYNTNKIWRIRVKSKEALGQILYFSKLNLSSTAELYISNTDGTTIFGPITSKENLSEGYMATSCISGDEIIMQLIEPLNSKEASTFTLSKIGYSFEDFFNEAESSQNRNHPIAVTSSDLLSCHNNVDCYSNWINMTNGIVFISSWIYNPDNGMDMLSRGSGALVNNTLNDGTPYILTALHCCSKAAPLSQRDIINLQGFAVTFGYKENCISGVTNSFATYTGAHFKACYSETDMILVQLNNWLSHTPCTYLGWDKSSSQPTSAGGIHHPEATPMKLSLSNQIYSGFTFEHEVRFYSGILQYGSSGSPLFNQNHRIIGQASTAYNDCNYPLAYYGKFDKSWNGGGTDNTSLKKWLDPLGTNPNTLAPLFSYLREYSTDILGWTDGNGYHGETSDGNAYRIIQGTNANISIDYLINNNNKRFEIRNGLTEQIIILSAISNNPSVFSVSWSGNKIQIHGHRTGIDDLIVEIVDGSRIMEFLIPISVETYDNYRIYPNPASSMITISTIETSNEFSALSTTVSAPDNCIKSVKIYNIMGNIVINKTYNSYEKNIQLSISSLIQGVYNVIINDDNKNSSTLIINR
jgi:hypothetical protein